MPRMSAMLTSPLCAEKKSEPEAAMHHHLIGPFWGNILIVGVAGAITVACFVAMFWFIFHPGEKDRHHPKNAILRDDR